MLNLSGRTALVTGVADNVGFAWHIAKRLNEYGADIIISCHPRVRSILDRYLEKDKYKDSRMLDNGKEFAVKQVISCDVAYDDASFMSDEQKNAKGYKGNDVSISGMAKTLKDEDIKINALIHSVAFSPEIDARHINVSRNGYLTAMSISAYSLVSLSRFLLPLMDKNSSIVSLSYLAAERAVPFYGGGMASAKAALECDTRMLSTSLGEYGHRINVISAGPYASRAAKSIGDVDHMIEHTKKKSPLKAAIDASDVADAALFLVSDLSKKITGETLHVDAGFHAMALV